MNRTMSWFAKADLKAYRGKYVVIAKGRIILSGSEPGKIYEKAKARYPRTEVILWKVPEGEMFAFQLKIG